MFVATQASSKQYSSVLYSGPSISADGTYEILLGGKSAGTVPPTSTRPAWVPARAAGSPARISEEAGPAVDPGEHR